MKHISTAIKGFTAATAILCTFVLSAMFYIDSTVPEHYYCIKDNVFSVTTPVGPIVPTVTDTDQKVQTNENSSTVDEVTLSLFGIFPIKEVSVQKVSQVMLAPCGTPFGVKILTDGVIVVGLNEITTKDGTRNPAKEAGIQTGDIIYEIDGVPVTTNDEVATVISKSSGKAVTVSLLRSDKRLNFTLQPVLSSIDNNYKAGLWVRDSSAGIGTISFYDPSTGAFGGLGHAICDIDTGEVLPVLRGDVVNVTIHNVVKSTVGSPGELRGSFTSENSCGTIFLNNACGVFGKMFSALSYDKLVPLGFKQDVKTGKATVYTTIDGNSAKGYEIEIERIDLKGDSPTKNMVIHITDPALLEKCGGIVQGMSGSPIVQDGKLIGAVTHVFVNDPTRGYAIFAENMYENVATMQNDS